MSPRPSGSPGMPPKASAPGTVNSGDTVEEDAIPNVEGSSVKAGLNEIFNRLKPARSSLVRFEEKIRVYPSERKYRCAGRSSPKPGRLLPCSVGSRRLSLLIMNDP